MDAMPNAINFDVSIAALVRPPGDLANTIRATTAPTARLCDPGENAGSGS